MPPKRKDNKPVIYTRLPTIRADRGLSRKDVARILGVHYQTVGYIERGEYVPSLEIALKLSAHFGLPVEAIFSLTPFHTLGAEALSEREQKSS